MRDIDKDKVGNCRLGNMGVIEDRHRIHLRSGADA